MLERGSYHTGPQKGCSGDPNNYRPISLTSNCCKVMERKCFVCSIHPGNQSLLVTVWLSGNIVERINKVPQKLMPNSPPESFKVIYFGVTGKATGD